MSDIIKKDFLKFYKKHTKNNNKEDETNFLKFLTTVCEKLNESSSKLDEYLNDPKDDTANNDKCKNRKLKSIEGNFIKLKQNKNNLKYLIII
jgi:hypothetical protein